MDFGDGAIKPRPRAFLGAMSSRITAYVLFVLGAVVGVANVVVMALGGYTGWGPLLSGALLLAGVGLLSVEQMRRPDE